MILLSGIAEARLERQDYCHSIGNIDVTTLFVSDNSRLDGMPLIPYQFECGDPGSIDIDHGGSIQNRTDILLLEIEMKHVCRARKRLPVFLDSRTFHCQGE